MASKNIADLPWKTIGWGTLVFVLVMFVLFAALWAPQCPDGYSQQQINAEGCIVGANIGLGLLLFCAPIIWALSVLGTAAVVRARRKRRD